MADERDHILILAGLGALALAIVPPAKADETDHTQVSAIVIDQTQVGTVWSEMELDVLDGAPEVVSTSTAVGNAAAGALKSGDLDLDVEQELLGAVGAENTVTGGMAGNTVVTTTAYGNSSTGGTWNGNNSYRADQDAYGDVSADTVIDMTGSGHIASATTAMANVSVPEDEFGKNGAFQIQNSNGSVRAETDADLCCNGHSATYVTTAGGNAVSSVGWSSANLNGAVQTTAAGETISGSTDVYQTYGTHVQAATSTFGNSATVHNEWGYATLGREGSELYQENNSSIDGQTYVTLDNWYGSASSTAYGVGNSALISNVGSDTGLNAIQNNFGDVYTSASFAGGTSDGGHAIVNATSIGNAATATLCNYCGDASLQGSTIQRNDASITARGTVTQGSNGSVYGSATAVGNSATYQSTGH
ncbi:MAG: holdfast anchor protein HfaD [Henriciella sp.]|nr:holdfast anchor protein HfaD [Henriciella sp.]